MNWPKPGSPVATGWMADFSLHEHGRIVIYLLKDKGKLCQEPQWELGAGCWLCLDLAAVQPEAWEEERTMWPTAACLSVWPQTLLPSAQNHNLTFTVWISRPSNIAYCIFWFLLCTLSNFCVWAVGCGCPALIFVSLQDYTAFLDNVWCYCVSGLE